MEKIRILLDWTLDAKHAVLVEARNRGFFEKAGIDIDIMEPASKSAAAVSRLYDGEADLAINYPHNIVLMQKECPGIISVGSLVGSNPEGLLSLEDSGISTPADLKGRRIGVGPSPVSVAQLEVFLAENGLKQEEVTLVTVGFEGEELLLKDEIDALDAVAYAIPRTLNKGRRVRFMAYTGYGLPDSPFLVFAAAEEWARAHRDLLQGFFAVLREGLAAVEAWTRADWESYVQDIPGREAPEEQQIWDRIHPAMAKEPLFKHDHQGLEGLMDILRSKGILAEPCDLNRFFPNDYI